MSEKPSEEDAKKAPQDSVDPIVVYDVQSLMDGVTRQLEEGK